MGTPQDNAGLGIIGTYRKSDESTDLNAIDAVVRSIVGKRAFATLVRVTAVNNAGEATPVGLLDVQPLVAQVDGLGNLTPHGVIHNLPYFRLQGGADAIILDPKVGDLGLAVICDRDISTVKETKAAAGPGSHRQNSMADGLYIGGFLNGTPAQFVRFSTDGIEILSPAKVMITAPNIVLTASTKIAMIAPTITEN